jgi:DNA modification methylase
VRRTDEEEMGGRKGERKSYVHAELREKEEKKRKEKERKRKRTCVKNRETRGKEKKEKKEKGIGRDTCLVEK